jgi:hypothetical protein
LFIYILTLNFLNQTSIIGFHSGFWKILLCWNKSTSINDFIINVIVQATLIIINLNFHLFIKIYYSIFIHCCLIFFLSCKKGKQTYMLWLSFQWEIYFLKCTSCLEGTPPLWVAFALDELASRDRVCAWGASSWLTPSGSCPSEVLLEEPVMLMSILFFNDLHFISYIIFYKK